MKNVINGLSDLKWGLLSEDQSIFLEKESNVFTKNCSMFLDEMYPNVHSTFTEVKNIISNRKSILESKEKDQVISVSKVVDQDLLGMIGEVCEELEIEFKKDYLFKIAAKLSAFSLKLKMHYNRPRPYQFSLYTSQKLKYTYSENVHSPSYPSCASITTYFIMKVIAFHNPEKEADLMEYAKIITDTRIFMGVNYESDILFGRYIVDELCQIKSIKDIYLNEKKLKSKESETESVEEGEESEVKES